MNNRRKFEKNMRRMLRKIQRGTLDTTCLSLEESECLYECQQRGFIRGLHLARNVDGYLIGNLDRNLSILYPGYIFLSERFPNLRSNIAIMLSILALIVSIVCEFTPLPGIVKQMFL